MARSKKSSSVADRVERSRLGESDIVSRLKPMTLCDMDKSFAYRKKRHAHLRELRQEIGNKATR